ncbi:flagellar assembly protein FliW [Pseudothauera rhizosphaerae]|uniref:Flagellar assembly factor FliW n=1 Tax=Pseudothauera rhizosphaerae TaxID=2565932 RepID=A0A4S4ALE5_9RHOO|nr:flagellar assembly protein FliW [Pseudothauera rhizosphaerae]THF60231.1 flagellar biosynthesis protein FliW [Pseudothauera rhizosphaerae]
MKVESTLFGSFEVAEDKIIEFPAGLPGFEGYRRFALVHEEGAEATVQFLQSLDDAEVAFPLADPVSFGIHYEFVLSDEEQALLGLSAPEQALVAVIVRKETGAGLPDSAGLRANFMAPLVINAEARRGLQKVMNKVECDITMRARD